MLPLIANIWVCSLNLNKTVIKTKYVEWRQMSTKIQRFRYTDRFMSKNTQIVVWYFFTAGILVQQNKTKRTRE